MHFNNRLCPPLQYPFYITGYAHLCSTHFRYHRLCPPLQYTFYIRSLAPVRTRRRMAASNWWTRWLGSSINVHNRSSRLISNFQKLRSDIWRLTYLEFIRLIYFKPFFIFQTKFSKLNFLKKYQKTLIKCKHKFLILKYMLWRV